MKTALLISALILGCVTTPHDNPAVTPPTAPMEMPFDFRFEIIIPPKTFFEKTFPQAQPPWPSNKQDRRGLTPLQVV